MSVALHRTGAAQPSERSAPHDLNDAVLMERLAAVQIRTREMMADYNIASANVSIMAWQAEQAIEDTALRAEFLRLLIDLHEFGRQARQRGLLAPQKTKASPPARAADRGTSLFATDEEGADTVSCDASRALFQFLDR